jgi:hypothetical protein
MGAYNKRENNHQKDEPKVSINCPAQDCPLRSSVFLDGGPWTCRYHAKQPKQVWPKITQIITENNRWINLIQVAGSVRPEEYDNLMSRDAFELDELVRPTKGELHTQWVFRVKDTIYRALKHKINEAVEDNETRFRDSDQNSSKWAVKMLTSGELLKKVKR